MGGIANCCCGCEDCGLIPVGDLPLIVIDNMTGGEWEAVSPCCWKKEFTPNTSQDWTFTDGGALQTDGWTVVSDYEYTWLMVSRGNLVVAGKIRRVDSGGPYAPVDIGDADWRTGATGSTFEYVVDPYPSCPTCQTEVCVEASVSNNQESMQRWGVYSQFQGITVSLQKILVTCSAETEPTCQYIMSSRKRYKYKTYFATFNKQHITKTFTQPGGVCCELPANTDDLDDYPDFNSVLSYSLDVPPTDFEIQDIVSVRVLADLDEQDVEFGWNICDDCVPSGVAFCLGDCSDNCLTTEGTGIVGAGPFGHAALCEYMDPNECTYTQNWGITSCIWSAQFTWSDGQIDCVSARTDAATYGLPAFEDLRSVVCESSWSIYYFGAEIDCGDTTPPQDDNSLGLVFGLDEDGNAVSGEIGDGCPASTIFTPSTTIGTACAAGDSNPQRIGGVGTMTSLTYTPYCSGAVEQTLCFEDLWTVTILPTAPDP